MEGRRARTSKTSGRPNTRSTWGGGDRVGRKPNIPTELRGGHRGPSMAIGQRPINPGRRAVAGQTRGPNIPKE
eukprot:1425422-Lingulodinium_polyedra.AAC.1